jgi:hypothetical protein
VSCQEASQVFLWLLWRATVPGMNTGLPQELLDAAQRMRDAVNLHVAVSPLLGERRIGFLAIRLDTGSAHDGGTLYDTRPDAVKHTKNESGGFFYVKVGADTMKENESIIVLQMARRAYAAGVVFAEEEPVTPMLTELALPYIPNTIRHTGLILPNRRTNR